MVTVMEKELSERQERVGAMEIRERGLWRMA